MNQEEFFKKITAHAKEYGFVFPSSDIYDGLSAVYDYGQNGVELKNNIRQYWWKAMVQMHENIVGVDAAIFMHPTVWKASGHVDAFNDPMIDNKDSKKRYRADVLVEDHIAKIEDKINKEVEKAKKRFGDAFDKEQFVSTNARVLGYKQEIEDISHRLYVAMAGCIANGISEAVAQSLYDEIVAFANYAFNKAHAVCYAVVSYQTAYLKCHYPKQYMAALMTSVLDSAAKISGYITECKDMGIPVLPPDVNHSEDQFTVDGDAIRFGLGAVKNVGHGLVRAMCAKREEGGPFKSLEDFIQRMGDEINKRAVENFIKCGAMDCFGHHRSELLAVYDRMMDAIASTRKKNLEGQIGLFSLLEDEDEAASIPIPKLPEMSKGEMLNLEKETM
ncbi:MAG: hypothetical protein IIV21_01455, partial [Bacteroidales bacterium]|nr:hypothetical protein [Bacteroidales bacterium]